MKRLILKNRYSLLVFILASYICLVVLEGIVMDRESRVYQFENPYFDLNR